MQEYVISNQTFIILGIRNKSIIIMYHNTDCHQLINLLGSSHGALDVERADVLPVLLQQRDKEVNGQVDIGHQVILTHLNVTNGYSKTKDLCVCVCVCWGGGGVYRNVDW